MELFFLLTGVFAVAAAAVAATASILMPGPKHLVMRVFFGTIGFIFGGAVSTAIVVVIVAESTNSFAPSFTIGGASLTTLVCSTYHLATSDNPVEGAMPGKGSHLQ